MEHQISRILFFTDYELYLKLFLFIRIFVINKQIISDNRIFELYIFDIFLFELIF